MFSGKCRPSCLSLNVYSCFNFCSIGIGRLEALPRLCCISCGGWRWATTTTGIPRSELTHCNTVKFNTLTTEKTSKLCIIDPLYEGKPLVTGEFPHTKGQKCGKYFHVMITYTFCSFFCFVWCHLVHFFGQYLSGLLNWPWGNHVPFQTWEMTEYTNAFLCLKNKFSLTMVKMTHLPLANEWIALFQVVPCFPGVQFWCCGLVPSWPGCSLSLHGGGTRLRGLQHGGRHRQLLSLGLHLSGPHWSLREGHVCSIVLLQVSQLSWNQWFIGLPRYAYMSICINAVSYCILYLKKKLHILYFRSIACYIDYPKDLRNSWYIQMYHDMSQDIYYMSQEPWWRYVLHIVRTVSRYYPTILDRSDNCISWQA